MSEKSNRGKYLVTGGLLLLLLVFPAISWYYLRTGLDYRAAALGELGDYGSLPDLSGTPFFVEEIAKDVQKGKVVITSFIDNPDGPGGRLYGENLNRLHDQFDERDDLLFVNYVFGTDSISWLEAYAENYELDDEEQVLFLNTDLPTLGRAKGFHLPEGKTYSEPVFVLADTSGMVRNFYDVADENAVKRMVEHIALILPYKGRPKAELKREKEK